MTVESLIILCSQKINDAVTKNSYPQVMHRLYIIHRWASFMPELSTGCTLM
jgi:hypothetical protein